jgi:3-methyladenine DNA glycosylase AlkC
MQKKEASSESAFKHWISADVVKTMAAHIHHHDRKFLAEKFLTLSKVLGPLELKARIKLLSQGLHDCLGDDFEKSLETLLQASLKPATGVEALKGFALWPFTDFIQTFGLDHVKKSLMALYKLTPLFTAEFAVRPFLSLHPQATYAFLLKCTLDKNEHIRRWASEGSRPRLPWGEQIKVAIRDPSQGLEILEALRYDDSEYVRKSVANHLNDISKDHPKVALQTAKRWLKQSPSSEKKKIQWIVRHGLRTLLKKGDIDALKILGYQGKVQIKGLGLSQKCVRIGQSLEFEFELKSKEDTRVMVDYVLHHQKANGKTSPKVFKLTVKELKAGKSLVIRKKHSFKLVTTRAYYPGLHVLEIMVNGHRLGKVNFQLV